VLHCAEVDSAGPEGLCTEARCFQIAVRPEGDDADASAVESESALTIPRVSPSRSLTRRGRSAHVTHLRTYAKVPGRGAAVPRAQVRGVVVRTDALT